MQTRLAIGDYRSAGFHAIFGQQWREVAHVFFEEIESAGDPSLTEPHARAHTLRHQFWGTGIDGLLEYWDAGFMPEFVPGEKRGIRAQRGLHTRDGLRGIPRGREMVRGTLQV